MGDSDGMPIKGLRDGAGSSGRRKELKKQRQEDCETIERGQRKLKLVERARGLMEESGSASKRWKNESSSSKQRCEKKFSLVIWNTVAKEGGRVHAMGRVPGDP